MQLNRTFSQVLESRITQRPKKVAKTFSISEQNFQKLEQWCSEQNKRAHLKILPSNLVDELIAFFFENQHKSERDLHAQRD